VSAPDDIVSAADIEKFAYCPLSWWLSWTAPERDEKETLDLGNRLHEALTQEIASIPEKERAVREWETIVLWFAIGASIIAVTGVSFILALGYDISWIISWIMTVLALIWLLASTYFLYAMSRAALPDKRLILERLIGVFAMVATLIALNAVLILQVDRPLAQILEVAALIWLVAASVSLHRALRHALMVRARRAAHMITGDIKYVDTRGGRSELLVSKKYRLRGRPDYILAVENSFVPVDIKTGRVPKGPLFSHILQVAAYCMIVEDTKGACHHGIIKYGNTEHEVDLDDGLKTLVLAKADEIRKAMKDGGAHRNHNRPGKCVSCSRRAACPEKLA
jgi:CRISPR-associated exonuclease Cas4